MRGRPDESGVDEGSDAIDAFTELWQGATARAETDTGDPRFSDEELAARRRRRRRRGLTALLVVTVVLALVGGYAGWALNAPVPLPVAATRAPTSAVPDAVELSLPDHGGWALSVAGGEEYFAAAGTEGSDDASLWLAREAEESRSMASITKLVTALVVLDRRPLDGPDDDGPTLTFHGVQALYDKYYVQNATVARMRPGSTMTQRDVLEMMLVISASNYAEAAAVWAYGSTWSFVQAADAWLDEHGLTGTRLVEPSGIDPRNVSTPSDMIRLGKLAMADPVIAEIVGMAELEVPGFSGVNTNSLVRNGIARGIKTGTLDAEGANLLFSARLDVGIEPLIVTGVVLGGSSQGHNASVADELMSTIRAGFHTVAVGEAGRGVGDYVTAWGATARMVMAADAQLLTWSDTPVEVDMTTSGLSTGSAGEKVGTITWTAGPETATVDLVLDRDIELPDAWWRLTHPFELAR